MIVAGTTNKYLQRNRKLSGTKNVNALKQCTFVQRRDLGENIRNRYKSVSRLSVRQPAGTYRNLEFTNLKSVQTRSVQFFFSTVKYELRKTIV